MIFTQKDGHPEHCRGERPSGHLLFLSSFGQCLPEVRVKISWLFRGSPPSYVQRAESPGSLALPNPTVGTVGRDQPTYLSSSCNTMSYVLTTRRPRLVSCRLCPQLLESFRASAYGMICRPVAL